MAEEEMLGSPSYERLLRDRVAILEAPPGSNAAPPDIVLTYAAASVEACDAVSGRPVWPRAVPCRLQPTLLGTSQEAFILATRHRVFALRESDGLQMWASGGEPAEDPKADPEWSASWIDQVMAGGNVVLLGDRGELLCLGASDGNVQWRAAEGPRTAGRIAATSRHVFSVVGQPPDARLVILDVETGQRRGEVKLPADQTLQRLLPTGGNVLLLVMTQSVVAVEPESARIIWTTAADSRFVAASAQVFAGALFVTMEGRGVLRYELEHGKPTWSRPAVPPSGSDGLWAKPCEDRLLVASGNLLCAFDIWTGRLSWSVPCDGCLGVQAPRVAGGEVFVLREARPIPVESAGPASRPAEARPPATRSGTTSAPTTGPVAGGSSRGSAGGSTGLAPAYRIDRFMVFDGRPKSIGGRHALRTEPISSFGGLCVTERAIILLDGDRLLGYVLDD